MEKGEEEEEAAAAGVSVCWLGKVLFVRVSCECRGMLSEGDGERNVNRRQAGRDRQ